MRKQGRACWPSGMWRSGSELPGRMGAEAPACTASPTPRCCGASMYANPRLSPPAPADRASVKPAGWCVHQALCARPSLHLLQPAGAGGGTRGGGDAPSG